MQWEELKPPAEKNLFIPKYMHQDFKKDAKGEEQIWSFEDVERTPELLSHKSLDRWFKWDDTFQHIVEGDPSRNFEIYPASVRRRRHRDERRSPHEERKAHDEVPSDLVQPPRASQLTSAERFELQELRKLKREMMFDHDSTTNNWMSTRAQNYLSKCAGPSNFAYDPCCPYCSNLDYRAPMFKTSAGGGIGVARDLGESAGIVRGPNGSETIISHSTNPPEQLPPNELNSSNKVTVWQSEMPGNEHTVLTIDKTLIECHPRTSNVHVSTAPSLDQWKQQYHHSGAMPVGNIDCFVAYTPTAPRTHIWISGMAVHTQELVNLIVTDKNENT